VTDQTRDHMARITVTDAVWGEFREAARVRGISVTTYLGQIVSKEVTKLRAGAAKAEALTARHAHAALDDVHSLRDDLEALAERLEILTTHPEVERLATAPRPDRRPAAVAKSTKVPLDLETSPTPEELAAWKREAAAVGDDWFLRRASTGPDVPDWEP
jgi:hypothetical protein